MLVAESVMDYATDVGEDFELIERRSRRRDPGRLPNPITKDIIHAVFLVIASYPVQIIPIYA